MPKRYPWYWAWHGWRASTWIFLLWSALVWPQVATFLRDDGWLSHDLATAFVIFWILGVWFIVMARALASLARAERPPKPERSSLGNVVRGAAPFVAVALLGVLLAGPYV